ncbi:MAG: glycerophosphodiester phosphodiesterase family protein [Anaerolineae bacterium]
MAVVPFMAIAHRGASSYAPENTFAAYDLALQMGARHIELDVHLTTDGHVVVIHDDLLDRTTDGTGPVAAHSLAELRLLDAGSRFGAAYSGARIPTLSEVLACYGGRVHLHIEIKGTTPGLVPATVALVRQYGMASSVTITSFHLSALEETRRVAPDLPTGWLVGVVNDAIVADTLRLGLTQLCPRADLVTPALVDDLHARGLVVRAWGVSDEQLMAAAIEAGVDGMTVNFPDVLLAALAEHS